MVIIMALISFAAGCGLAVQGGVNMALGIRTNRLQAATLSFLGGLLVLAFIVVPFFGKGNLRLLTQAKPWQLLGGVYGAFSVYTCIACMPLLGVALTLVLTMFGQLLMGSVIDGFGLLGTNAIQISGLRIAGFLVTALGIVLIYSGNRQNETDRAKTADAGGKGKGEKKKLLIMGWAFGSGMLASLQAPTNASLAGIVGGCESATVSFAVGFLCLAALLLILSKGKPQPLKGAGIRPWMLTGGLYGVFSVFTNIITVVVLGAALQSICMLAGQLGGGILIDSAGLFQAKKMKINSLRVTGVLIIVAGSVLVSLGKMYF